MQRSSRASVSAGDDVLGSIGSGALVLVGIGREDTPDVVDRMADKLVGLRFFRDPDGRTNLSIAEAEGSFLVVSQFTLYADISRGRRPGFTQAAPPDVAVPLVDRLVDRLRSSGIRVETGRFGSEMAVELVNDGPFTLVLDSEDLSGPG